MSLYSRRRFGMTLAAATIAGCGFTPIYGPKGEGAALLGQISMSQPKNRNAYLLHQRIEERLGQAPSGKWLLIPRITTENIGLGYTEDGKITRYNIAGSADYTLQRTGSQEVSKRGKAQHFTSSSATGTTVATLAAERNARDRLMTILADQIIDQLLLIAGDLRV